MAKAKRRTSTTKATGKKTTSSRRAGSFNLDTALATLPAAAGSTPPSMPVAALLQEASDVAQAATKHAAKLRKLPFDHALLTTLAGRRDALAKAETAWRAARSKSVAKSGKSVEDATKLRSELIAAGRYLLRDDDATQRELDEIAAGDGIADLISDLDGLATLAARHRDALGPATMRGGIDKAIESAKSLAANLRTATSERRTDSGADEAVLHRNRCAGLLEHALREVRAAARYALRGDERALKPFRGTHVATRRRARKGSTPAPSGGGTPTS